MDNLERSKSPNQSNLALHGWEKYARKEYDQAEIDLRAALDIDPNDIDTQFALGLTLKAKGQGHEAIKYFQNVISLINRIDDPARAQMMRRITSGHINDIQIGNWNPEGEIWQK